MNFVQPSIDPIIISISFIDIRWYSLLYNWSDFWFSYNETAKQNKGGQISSNYLDSFLSGQ